MRFVDALSCALSRSLFFSFFGCGRSFFFTPPNRVSRPLFFPHGNFDLGPPSPLWQRPLPSSRALSFSQGFVPQTPPTPPFEDKIADLHVLSLLLPSTISFFFSPPSPEASLFICTYPLPHSHIFSTTRPPQVYYLLKGWASPQADAPSSSSWATAFHLYFATKDRRIPPFFFLHAGRAG